MSDGSEMYDRKSQTRRHLTTSIFGTGDIGYAGGSVRSSDLSYFGLNIVSSDELQRSLTEEREDESSAMDLSNNGIFELTALPLTEDASKDLDSLQEKLTKPQRPHQGQYAGSPSKRIGRGIPIV